MTKETAERVREELDLAIDESNLPGEWQVQASMMLDYGIQLADAMAEVDESRAKLSVIDAGLDRDIRSDPDAYDIAKATETTVPACINEQPEHIKALKRVNQARHTQRVLQAAVDALSHRKNTLQGMTELWLRQYYADPTSNAQPANLRDASSKKKVIKGRKRRKAE